MSDLLPSRLPSDLPLDRGKPALSDFASTGEEAAQAPTAGILRFFFFLRKFWWIPLLTLTLSGVGAVFYIKHRTPPTYVSYARMWETEKLNLPGGAAFTTDVQTYIGTQLELLRSGKLMQLAFARIQARDTNAIPRNKAGQAPNVDLRVMPVPKSTIFVVQASSSNPQYVTVFLDALMEEYFIYKKEIRKRVSGDTLMSIQEQVARLERELKEDQDAFSAFQRTNNLAILQEESKIAGAYLARLKTQISDLKLESQLLEATSIEQSSGGSGSTNSALDLADAVRRTGSTVAGASSSERLTPYHELEVLKSQREKLSKYLRPKHPKIVKLDADIEKAQELIRLYHNQSRDQLAANRQALKLRIDGVLESIKEWEGKVVESNSKIAEAERLKANINRSQGLYDRLISLLQNVDISRNIEQETLNILEPASPAIRSYQREKSLLTTALFGGLLLGMGIVFLIERKDDRFTSLTEVADKFGEVVGEVPEMTWKGPPSRIPLLTENQDYQLFAESYRSIRSALLFLPFEGDPPQIFLVTSAIPNEGKSTVAANLARTLAEGGARVLLVDADMRKGHLHEVLGLQSAPGLAELLLHPTDKESFIQPTPISNLSFIASGRMTGNPGSLFLGAGFSLLLARWREAYDHVIIDTCPVFAADDATSLAPKVDGTLFVVRSRFSSASCVREALDLLARRQARVLGLVFNRAKSSSRSYYYRKYADYYSGRENNTNNGH